MIRQLFAILGFVLFILSVTDTLAQEVDVPYSADTSHLSDIIFTTEDMIDFELVSSKAWPGFVYDGEVCIKTYVGADQVWLNTKPPYSRISPGMVKLRVFRCDSQSDAAKLMRRWRGEVTNGRDLSQEFPALGEVVHGNEIQGWLGFMRGNVFIHLGVEAGIGELETVQLRQAALLQMTIDRIGEKLPPTVPLEALRINLQLSATEIFAGSRVPILLTSQTEGEISGTRVRYERYDEESRGEPSGDIIYPLGPVPETLSFNASNLLPGEHEFIAVVIDDLERYASDSVTLVVLPQSSGPVTLPTTKDSTLRAQKPHRNEGANPRLFLSHRLEARGKANNPLVGFDLTNANLNGMTKATLVMNIQDCDVPKRWGKNGRFIEAYPVIGSWVEGNGNKYRVNGGNGKTKGQGQGVTWFSPVDNKIQNNRPNGSSQWSGARNVAGALTAPAEQVTNKQTGPIEFDVTNDLAQTANLAEISWLLKKQDEAKFGNIRFYSKEGAAEAGDSNLAPKLVLEFGGPIAAEHFNPSSLLSRIGLSKSSKLRSMKRDSELPSVREALQESPAAAFAGETLLSTLSGRNPALGIVTRTAYRTWLNDDFTLALDERTSA